MKLLITILIIFSTVSCATTRVNVDFDSCIPRGLFDGISIYSCKEVKLNK